MIVYSDSFKQLKPSTYIVGGKCALCTSLVLISAQLKSLSYVEFTGLKGRLCSMAHLHVNTLLTHY